MSLTDATEQLDAAVNNLRSTIDKLLKAAAAEIIDELGGTAIIATADEYGEPFVAVTLVGAGPRRPVSFGVPDNVASAAARIEHAILLDRAAALHARQPRLELSRTITP